MPHLRKRHAAPLVLKRLKSSRVLTLQGARQTGKSVLAREILPAMLPHAAFETFDRAMTKRFAQENPDTFLEKNTEFQPLIIDEAQKVPEIFDAVKHQVDLHPAPGRYILLGSSEFSREVKIRESLTGRMSRIRLYPFNLAEALQLPENPSKAIFLTNRTPRCHRADLLRHLKASGMPGVFALRTQADRESFFEDWISLVTTRDLLLFVRLNPDPDLADAIIRAIPKIEMPDSAHLSRHLRENSRRIQKHLMILEQLFVLHKILPHRLSAGKPLYFLLDGGLAGHLGASMERQLQTWLLHEQLSQHSYRDDRTSRLSYYRSARGGLLDLICETPDSCSALKIIPRESIDLRDFMILEAFRKKAALAGNPKVELTALAPVAKPETIEGVKVFPWESIV